MGRFKSGDRVIVDRRPDGSDACIDKDFPFDDIVHGQEEPFQGRHIYRLESGWSVYEDMLTFADHRVNEHSDIVYILGLELSDAVKIAAIKRRMEVR